MARVFIDGFEGGHFELWEASGSNPIVESADAGMLSDYQLFCAADDWIKKTVPSATEYYVSLRSIPRPTYKTPILNFMNGTSYLVRIKIEGSGPKFVKAYVGTTLIGTGTVPIDNTDTVPSSIQARAYIANSGGRIVVKVDGLIDIDYTGDTQTGATDQIDGIQLGDDDEQGYKIDDVVIDDSEFPGDSIILGLQPNGAGNSTQYTPSAGANWEAVNETPPSEADYVSTNTNGNLDLYTLEDMTGDVGTVKCIQHDFSAKITTGSPVGKIKSTIRTNSTDFSGSDETLATNYLRFHRLMVINPDTSNPWTESEINALEAGYTAVT